MRIIVATPHRRHDELVHKLASTSGCDVVRIADEKNLSRHRVEEIRPEYIFFPHWSWKIPEEIFENYECVIFHMTDLPYGRGGSPLQNLIRRGHTETKLSALRCVAEMDAGPVYAKRSLLLLGTAEEILMRAASLIEKMIVEIIDRRLQPLEQLGEAVVFRRLKPADGNLEQVDTLEGVFDRIRMLDGEGYPPAFIEFGGFRIEFSRASLMPGSVVADAIICRSEKQG